MFKTKKPTPALLKEDELRMQEEIARISGLDPNSKAAQRRAAFYERCKTTDTKLQNLPPKKYYNQKPRKKEEKPVKAAAKTTAKPAAKAAKTKKKK